MKTFLRGVVVAMVIAVGGVSQVRADEANDRLTAHAWKLIKPVNGQLVCMTATFDKSGAFSLMQHDIDNRPLGTISGRYELTGGYLKLYVDGKQVLSTPTSFSGENMLSGSGTLRESWSPAR